MQLPLSGQSETVMSLATNLVRQLQHPEICVIHVLVGISQQLTNKTGQMLRALGASTEAIMGKLESFGFGKGRKPSPEVLRRSVATTVLFENASDLAKTAGREKVCPIHLFRAMTEFGSCSVLDLLTELGVDAAEVVRRAEAEITP